jgi:hypothetical protein
MLHVYPACPVGAKHRTGVKFLSRGMPQPIPPGRLGRSFHWGPMLHAPPLQPQGPQGRSSNLQPAVRPRLQLVQLASEKVIILWRSPIFHFSKTLCPWNIPAFSGHPRSIQLRTPIAGLARGLHYPASGGTGYTLIRWDLSHDRLSPTG